MKIKEEFVLREIAGDYIVIPTGKAVLEFNGLISVNEVGASIWKLLQKETDFEEIVRAVLGEYETDRETAEKDIRGFLDDLDKNGILEK